MDRGAWQVQSMGSRRVRHDLANKTTTKRRLLENVELQTSHIISPPNRAALTPVPTPPTADPQILTVTHQLSLYDACF